MKNLSRCIQHLCLKNKLPQKSKFIFFCVFLFVLLLLLFVCLFVFFNYPKIENGKWLQNTTWVPYGLQPGHAHLNIREQMKNHNLFFQFTYVGSVCYRGITLQSFCYRYWKKASRNRWNTSFSRLYEWAYMTLFMTIAN